MDDAAVKYVEDVAKGLKQKGVKEVEQRLVHGQPAASIVDMAKDTPGSLVAMTTHGRSGVGRWVLGSAADRVVRHSGSPVLLIRAADIP